MSEASAAAITGPNRETSQPGISSRQSTVCRPAGTGTAENPSCAGTASTGRPSSEIDREPSNARRTKSQPGSGDSVSITRRPGEDSRTRRRSRAGGAGGAPAGLEHDLLRCECRNRRQGLRRSLRLSPDLGQSDGRQRPGLFVPALRRIAAPSNKPGQRRLIPFPDPEAERRASRRNGPSPRSPTRPWRSAGRSRSVRNLRCRNRN